MHGSGVTTLCYDETGFSCASAGYNGTAAQFNENGWTSGVYWSAGSSGPNGSRHNCTTYAAYRLEQNNYAYPNWSGDGGQWARQAQAHGTLVNQTPAVGAIAQWNFTRDGGDVAYVEVVTSAYIEVTGDAYTEGTGRQRIAVGSPYWPDNFIHFHDTPPTAGGTAKTVSGDVTGDGHSDAVAFYRYANSQTKAWLFTGSAAGVGAPRVVWDSGVGKWNWDNMSVAAGDVNGDGHSDVVAIYRYPRNQTKVWVFYGTSAGLSAPRLAWSSAVGGWSYDNTALVAGDVNGDGHADVVAFYRYGTNRTKAFVMFGGSSGLSAPKVAWDSGAAGWSWDESKFVAGDFNGDHKADVVALYEYPNSQTKGWIFRGTSAGLSSPRLAWDSGVGKWN